MNWQEQGFELIGHVGVDSGQLITVATSINFEERIGLAVAFRSGYGDDCYPVYARIKNGRVLTVVIDMDEGIDDDP